MIEVRGESGEDLEIVIAPDRSSDWRTNQIIIGVLGSICLGIALAFYAVMGIWMILPFAGLEVIALAAGLYYASWKLNYRQFIRADAETLTLEKGVYRPKNRWVWPKQSVLLLVEPSKHDWSPPALTLKCADDAVEVAESLGKTEAEELVRILSGHLQVRRESTPRK